MLLKMSDGSPAVYISDIEFKYARAQFAAAFASAAGSLADVLATSNELRNLDQAGGRDGPPNAARLGHAPTCAHASW
jgi:hypothetical protein